MLKFSPSESLTQPHCLFELRKELVNVCDRAIREVLKLRKHERRQIWSGTTKPTNLLQLDGMFYELATLDAGLLNLTNLDTGVLGLVLNRSNERCTSFHRRPI